ncbi:uncharacterized protein LOC141850272 [Brevipalpus obovatus]|uniref:uncharacterized protein LOC141850272 n=1 Tax=Brevipalpus obovatus TaxID=246614 RepID=UPI003D9E7FB5
MDPLKQKREMFYHDPSFYLMFIKPFILARKRYASKDESVQAEWDTLKAQLMEQYSRQTVSSLRKIASIKSFDQQEFELMDAVIEARDIFLQLNKEADEFISKFLLPTRFYGMLLDEIFTKGNSNIKFLLKFESKETVEQVRTFIACVFAMIDGLQESKFTRKLFRSSL